VLLQTFFSTEVVTFQTGSSGNRDQGDFSAVALNRWLQLTLPLTFLTICGSWVAYKVAEKAQERLENQQKDNSNIERRKQVVQTEERSTRSMSWRRRSEQTAGFAEKEMV
jgi:type VI protein secretion system component VasK